MLGGRANRDRDRDTRSGFAHGGLSIDRSLPILLGTMIEEIIETAGEDQWQGFFRAIGRRLSNEVSVEGIEDPAELVEEMNRLWDALDWGSVTLELDDDGVDILHSDLPLALDFDDGNWKTVAPQILAGAYENWFRSLGGGRNLRTEVVQQSANLIQLRHGF